MAIYLLSTLTASQRYVVWKSGGADLPTEEHSIFVAGGANVPGKRLITPRGVVTKITDDDYAILKENAAFVTHVANGFITVSKSKPADPDEAAAGQAAKDGAAPLTESDFAPGEAPTTSPASPEAESVTPQTSVSGKKGK
jgi:hypothetical protein